MSSQVQRIAQSEAAVDDGIRDSLEYPSILGFAGILCKDGGFPETEQVERMLGSMVTDERALSATHHERQVGALIGWISRAADASRELIWNETGDVGVLFRGEVYSDTASGTTGTSVKRRLLQFLKNYEGVASLESLNGWFCGCVIDLRRMQVVLFNDRFGIGRLYVSEENGVVYFASQAKALLRILPKTRSFDQRSLGEFLSCGCALENRTLFSGVSMLPPASAWTCKLERVVSFEKVAYFNPSAWEQQPPLSEHEFYDHFKQVWCEILPRYFSEEIATGLSLTGGIDSRMILAWAKAEPNQMPCFTFGGRYRDCADVKIARRAAAIAKQPHHVLPIDGDFLRVFPGLAERTVRLSDGAMDVTGAIDLHVQAEASQISPIRVTGTNGGEIVRRLVAFKPMRQSLDAWDAELHASIRESATTYAQALVGNRLTFTAFKQAPWYMGAKFLVERARIVLRMPYFDNDLVKLMYRAPKALAESTAPALRLIQEGSEVLSQLGTDRGVHAKTNLARSANHWFQQFTFKAEYAYDYGMPQWLAKVDHALAGLRLEKMFLGRHKFHHFRVFYRDELARYVRSILLDTRSLSRSIVSRKAIERIVEGHTGGRRNYTLEIHKLLTVELIQRCLFEEN